MSFNIFKQSKTTFQISQNLLPLLVVAILTIIGAVGMFGFMFYPAQDRWAQAQIQHQNALTTQEKTRTARDTQIILSSIWKALPDYRTFTDLSLEIAALGERNHVKIPGMGYDFKTLPNKLAAKGTFSFKALGDYSSIRKFIYELEKRWPYLFIEKLSVESEKRKKRGVVFHLTVSTFLKDYPKNLKKKRVL